MAKHARNSWYLAAGTSETGDEPSGRIICEESVVLYRTADNDVVAQ